MVVTSSRLHAVRYMLAFQRYLEENGYHDIKPLVAFSGTVRDPDNGRVGQISVAKVGHFYISANIYGIERSRFR